MKTLSQAIHAIAGSPPRPGCADRAPFICWVCGNPATRGMDRARWQGANFTGQNRVRCSESDLVCEACVAVMAGRPPNTERLWTHLVEGASHVRVNRAQKPIMREFLRRAHLASWGAAIADSGQKHICPWAPLNPPNQSGGVILFEEAIVDLPRDEHGWSLLDELREILTDGATKEEIGRGEYGSRAWHLLGGRVRAFEAAWGHLRGGAWFDLALWLAQRDEERAAWAELLNARPLPSPPARGVPRFAAARFSEPRVVVEVAFTEWTDGKIRRPSFRGVRTDRRVEQCGRA